MFYTPHAAVACLKGVAEASKGSINRGNPVNLVIFFVSRSLGSGRRWQVQLRGHRSCSEGQGVRLATSDFPKTFSF